MQSYKIEDIPLFMSRLLTDTSFDHFLFVSARLTTFISFQIDGKYYPDFFSSTPETEQTDYAPWKLVRPHLLSLIRGNNRPLEMRLVFALSAGNLEQLLQSSAVSCRPSDIAGLYLNITYKGNELYCTGGTAMKIFTLDRQIDQLWDLTIQKILRNLKIPFIMNS